MSYPLFSSLRIRLIQLALLAFLPAFGLLLYAAVEQRQLTTSEVRTEVFRLARVAASQQERLVEGVRQLLTVLAKLPVVREGDVPKCNALFSELIQDNSRYANVGLIQPDGAVLASAFPLSGPVNLADRPYFQRAIQTRSFSIGDYQIGRITEKPTLNFGYPVFDQSGQIQTVVFASLNLSWLNTLQVDAQLPEGAVLFAVDSKGTVLAHYPESDPWVGKSMPEAPVVKAILKRQEGTIQTAGVDGIPRLYSFAPVTSGRVSGIYMSIGIPADVVFAKTNQMLARNLVVLGLVTFLVLVGTALYGERVILRPVRVLVNATKQLAIGDFSARVRIDLRQGEIGQLAQSFDEMAEALQERQKELNNTQEQLVQSEKLAALGRFSTGLAHEIKNPLGIILSWAEVLQQKVPAGDADGQVAIGKIKDAIRRADTIVQGLLKFAKPSQLKAERIQVEVVIKEVLSLLEKRLEKKNVEIHVQFPKGQDLWVNVDKNQIEQVLFNLLMNAAEAMPKGGKVTVTAYPLKDSQSSSDGRVCAIEITDEGEGISKGNAERIFEPFFTTKRESKGTGLGLSVSKIILKHHRGDLLIESEFGRGTTAKVILPLV